MKLAKISSKGQITIPKSIRKLLEIQDGDHIAIVVENGNAIIRKANVQIVKEKGS